MPDLVAAGIGAGASLLGSVMGANATKSAAREQADVGREQIAAGERQAMQAREDFTPYRELGEMGVRQLRDYRSPTIDFDREVTDRLRNYQESDRSRTLGQLEQRDLMNRLNKMGLGMQGTAAMKSAELTGRRQVADYEALRGELMQRYGALRGQADEGYNRILNLTKIGQGAAGSTAASAGQAATAMNAGLGTMAQAAGTRGAANAQLFSGMVPNLISQGASLGQLAQTGQNMGWWGSGGGVDNSPYTNPSMSGYGTENAGIGPFQS